MQLSQVNFCHLLAEVGELNLEEHMVTEEFLRSEGGSGLWENEDLDLTPDMKQLWEHVETPG